MNTAIQRLESAIKQFDGVVWSNHGEPIGADNDVSPGWVKFGLAKSELGWRTLEFLAWAFDDMSRAKKKLYFFPAAPPPYLNEPGECLSFVIECYIDRVSDQKSIQEISGLLLEWHKEYWFACKP